MNSVTPGRSATRPATRQKPIPRSQEAEIARGENENPNHTPANAMPETCQLCGQKIRDKPRRGQKPKWCNSCRTNGPPSRRKSETCTVCGRPRRHDCLTCSQACARFANGTSQPKQLELGFPRDQRSAIRRAYEDQDLPSLITAIHHYCNTSPITGCRTWTRRLKRGYGEVAISGQYKSVHRLVMGEPSGVVHHVCANRACCEPSHLQVVTHAENVAEMLERREYNERIAELEARIAELEAPNGMSSSAGAGGPLGG